MWFVVVAHGIRSLESFGDSAIVINQNPHRHRNDVRRTEARPHPACQSASGDVMRPGVAGGGRAKGPLLIRRLPGFFALLLTRPACLVGIGMFVRFVRPRSPVCLGPTYASAREKKDEDMNPLWLMGTICLRPEPPQTRAETYEAQAADTSEVGEVLCGSRVARDKARSEWVWAGDK